MTRRHPLRLIGSGKSESGNHGDIVVVMGRDTVTDPPDGKASQRRFTNVWRLEAGIWSFSVFSARSVRNVF